MSRVRINLGSGKDIDENAVNLDRNPAPGVDVAADLRQLPFRSDSEDEVVASSVLEHMVSPYEALDEIHRVMNSSGTLFTRVPALGTHAAHADPTHVFLADLKSWRRIFKSYFKSVRVGSEGVKYRDNKVLVAINHLAVKALRFHELAQVWTFQCRGKLTTPVKDPQEWWINRDGSVSEFVEKERRIHQ